MGGFLSPVCFLTCLRFAGAALIAVAQPVAVGSVTTTLAEGLALDSCEEEDSFQTPFGETLFTTGMRCIN